MYVSRVDTGIRRDVCMWHLFHFETMRDGRDEGGNGEIDEVDGASQGIEVP